VPSVDPFCTNSKIDDHLKKIVDVGVLWSNMTGESVVDLHGLKLGREGADLLSHLVVVGLSEGFGFFGSISNVNLMFSLGLFNVKWINMKRVIFNFFHMHFVFWHSGDLILRLSPGDVLLDQGPSFHHIQCDIMLRLVLDLGISESLGDMMWNLLFNVVPLNDCDQKK
jgi:hypothetical protein